MNIGLFGIYGVYNFGCEAIVRGAKKFLNDIYPDASITYYTYNYDYDKNALKDLEINIKPIKTKRNIFNRCINKICSVLNFDNRVLQFDYKEIIKDVDLIVSIGGDIYTIPKYLREREKYSYYNSLVEFCNKVVEAGKQVIVYGASIGPFGNYDKAVNYYKNNLKKYKLIICREQISLNYLKNLGLENTIFFPDPAFLVKDINKEKVNKRYIGVNLSPLSLKEIYGDCSVSHKIQLAKILKKIYNETKIDLLLIPHVISKDIDDDDLRFLNELKGLMNKAKNHVYIANTDKGFLGLKPQIRQCHMVISARMHCAVNAVVENVPTIFLSYSQKSKGMCEYIYESDKWVLDIKELNDQINVKIKEMIEKEDEISNYLNTRNIEVQKYYNENIKVIKKIMIN